MLKRALLGCLLVIVLSGCGAWPAIFGPSTGTVRGHVTVRACGGAYRPGQSGCTARPLAHAVVTVRLTSGTGMPSEAATATDATGNYIITRLPPGTYTVTLTAATPVVAAPRKVTVAAGKTVTVDFTWVVELL
jgi:hypothetical protein